MCEFHSECVLSHVDKMTWDQVAWSNRSNTFFTSAQHCRINVIHDEDNHLKQAVKKKGLNDWTNKTLDITSNRSDGTNTNIWFKQHFCLSEAGTGYVQGRMQKQASHHVGIGIQAKQITVNVMRNPNKHMTGTIQFVSFKWLRLNVVDFVIGTTTVIKHGNRKSTIYNL